MKEHDFWKKSCRHARLRDSLKAMATGLAKSLRSSAYVRNRVRGIDACANEFGCRPENFANCYRYLNGVQQKWNVQTDKLLPDTPMRLSMTYHAGEDFLDIANGLRAIDETLEYLDFPLGSRIGHALALGVEPKTHYSLKNNEIVTTKQDRLDDVVWALNRSNEFGMEVSPALVTRLRREAEQLLREIYGKALAARGQNISLNEYRESMRLRGDAPWLYETGKFVRPAKLYLEEYEEYAYNKADKDLALLRESLQITRLYYLYHFDGSVRNEGNRIIRREITMDYMTMMKDLQDAMMRLLENRGIVIECNPSSNVLIGTFGRYEAHPIFRFDNRLCQAGDGRKRTRMRVCVNTDDIGVFDTSLEFEYALLKQAAVERNRKQNQGDALMADVYEYLDHLREMGLEAVFQENVL